jgi:hypothetical protein
MISADGGVPRGRTYGVSAPTSPSSSSSAAGVVLEVDKNGVRTYADKHRRLSTRMIHAFAEGWFK